MPGKGKRRSMRILRRFSIFIRPCGLLSGRAMQSGWRNGLGKWILIRRVFLHWYRPLFRMRNTVIQPWYFKMLLQNTVWRISITLSQLRSIFQWAFMLTQPRAKFLHPTSILLKCWMRRTLSWKEELKRINNHLKVKFREWKTVLRNYPTKIRKPFPLVCRPQERAWSVINNH